MSQAVSGLYAVSPETTDPELLLRKVEAALRGGARVVQFRSKTAGETQRRILAGDIAQICRRVGACFIVNDSAELASEVDADGVHLGKQDGSVEAARALLGPGKLIGMSCYNQIANARYAAAQGVDYIAFGSFFPSPTKPGAVCATLDLLRVARREFSLPIVAIGGITADNAAELIEAGADAVAVVSALFEADDLEGEARRFARLFHARSRS